MKRVGKRIWGISLALGVTGCLVKPNIDPVNRAGFLWTRPERVPILPDSVAGITSLPTPVPMPRIFPDGVLASDDSGSKLVHHDYVVTKNGVMSTFIWVPVFEAYQLIEPQNSGFSSQPVGAWVANRPSTGVENVDWARETFGGFYVGKYEASHADANPGNPSDGSGASEGSSSALKVAKTCVPWTNVKWDQAAAACKSFDSACHLMEDDEWATLAIWSMVCGVTIYGNNSDVLSDCDDTGVRFIDDPTFSLGSRALTGSGYKAAWSASNNHTTHTGTTTGVYDLNGNVQEWTATLGSTQGAYRLTLKGQDTGVLMPSSGPIGSLSTDLRTRRYGVSGTTGYMVESFAFDCFYGNDSSTSMRGGAWGLFEAAGIWRLDLWDAKWGIDGSVGFRPVLSY